MQVKRILDEQHFVYFLHGLKKEIRGRVRSFCSVVPLSWAHFLNLACAIEREIVGSKAISIQVVALRIL